MNARWIVPLLLLAILLPTPQGVHARPAGAPATASPSVALDFGRMPLYFVANQGQLDARVAYYVQGHDKALYFTPQGVTFALALPGEGGLGFFSRLWRVDRWTVRLDFLGANVVRPRGKERTEAVLSYFKGSPDQWYAGLPTYSQVVYRALWAGIDLAYSGTADRLKYEFVVAPGADPADIRLAYRGAAVQVDESGQLQVRTPAGRFSDDAPTAYQEVGGQRVPVEVRYALEGSTYGFRLGAYDRALPLVVDPALLLYCGYIGGSDDDYGTGIALDAAGNLCGVEVSAARAITIVVGWRVFLPLVVK